MAGSKEESFANCAFKEIKKRINCADSVEDCSTILKEIHSCLFSSSAQGLFFNNSVKVREIFLEKYYGNTIEEILGLASRTWFNKYRKIYAEEFNLFFKDGRARDVFFGLTHVLSKEKHTIIIKECIDLLEKFAKTERFAEMFWEQAKVLPKTNHERIFYDPAVQMLWNEIIKRVISLPDRVSNIYKLQSGSILWPECFFKILGKMIIKVLKLVHATISASNDCSLGFLSQLFAKICIRNHGDEVYSILMPELEKLVKYSPLWCRICQKLFLSVDEPSLDAVIEPLIKKCKSYEFIHQLFGDFTKGNNSQLKYLMTHKYLFYRYYSKDAIPYCLIGYLKMCSNEECDILVETLKKLLEVWGSSSGIKHTSYEHHLYITKCILIAIGFLRQRYQNNQLPEQLATALTMKLLDSLPLHLESPIDKFRNLGMIVAEEISCISRVKDIEPLKFEFHRDDESLYLTSIAKDSSLILRRSEDEQILPETEAINIGTTEKIQQTKDFKTEESLEEPKVESELDSDDDLEPYPMDDEDDENLASGVRPPVYLSECISGLLSKDDPSRLEACLFVAEKLVRREPPELQELAVEFVKILLYLQDNYETKNFVPLRFGAMVATTVKSPKKVIAYLMKEFYEENYNLRQRMDILEVISASAQELSQPIASDPKLQQKHLPLPKIPGMTSKEKPDWQIIVEERIKNKTRIISHGRKNPLPAAVANKFNAIAGDFFFPLLKNFDSKCNTFDLLGQDFIVLGKLLQTLGSIIQAASGLTITRLMVSAMLDFIWGLRYHKEPFVRQALLYSICMCLLACPTNYLLTDLNAELMENHQWVTDVANNDPDTECRKLAMQTLMLLEEVVKKEFSQNEI